jgi:two-component system response regulator HydG
LSRSILVVDDDARIRTSLSEALSDDVTDVHTADSGEAALSAIGRRSPDLVVADVRMPGMDGLELLRVLRERVPDVAVILMTAFDDLPTVVRAMREGAIDFLVKPIDLDQLQEIIGKLFADRGLARRHERAQGDNAEPADRLIGHDPGMIRIFKMIGQVAASRTNVIIRGESGTGKELIARAIHDGSPHANEPFVPVNCTALPSTLLESELFGHVKGSFTGAAGNRKGRFALAGKGTIFLDEIGDTSPDFQSKLLRVLQEHEFYPVGAEKAESTEARVIAATHRDLEALVERGEFREDLYYRLRVVEITVPPLRERRADIAALAEHLIERAGHTLERAPPVLSREALEVLESHSWPGNVRELENCLTRATVMAVSGVIRPEHLALGSSPEAPVNVRTLDDAEREHVARTLEIMRGHKSRTAAALGISRPRLDRLIEKYELVHLAHTRDTDPSVPDE